MPDSEKPAQRDIGDRFVQHLRHASRKQGPQDPADGRRQPTIGSPKRASPDKDDLPASAASQTGGDSHQPKRRKTPESQSPANAATTPGSRNPARPRGRTSEAAQDFEAVPREHKKLWQDGSPALSRPAAPTPRGANAGGNTRGATSGSASRRGTGPSRTSAAGGGGGGAGGGGDHPFDHVNELVKQPKMRPISQEQLIAEVKGIYAGLVMFESSCIEKDTAQTSLNDNPDSPPLTHKEWRALIDLHKELLHEHHDFFLASQHPSAGPALRRLAAKYAMPARMWRHGIHSFLEVLRHRLPVSSEYMLEFIYLAYTMMTLLYETVPAFEDTWIECLGDLSRYRMAIEDDDIHVRNVWTAVSRSWYSQASDKAPTTGRLYHHLAILARPDVVAQLFYYLKSLTVAIPFKSARDSILTLFDPVMSGNAGKLLPTYKAFIQVHAVFFTNKNEHHLSDAIEEFLSSLDLTISRTTINWRETGYQISLSNIAAILGHGSVSNAIMKAITATRPEEEATADPKMQDADSKEDEWPPLVQQALKFAEEVDQIVFARLAEDYILPYLHVRLLFMHTMSGLDSAMSRLESTFAWHLLTRSLNSFLVSDEEAQLASEKAGLVFKKLVISESTEFPKTPSKPLPEDWALRGLVWTEHVFPADHFDVGTVEADERMFERSSVSQHRCERILWLAWNLAQQDKWIKYDASTRRFSPHTGYEQADIDMRPPPAKAAMDDFEILPDADSLATVTDSTMALSESQISEPSMAESPQQRHSTPTPVTIIQPDWTGKGSD